MSKVNDLLAELDTAFDTAEAKAKALADARQLAAEAITAKEAELETVKADHATSVAGYLADSQQAHAELDRLRQLVNDRIANLTGVSADPRVTVR